MYPKFILYIFIYEYTTNLINNKQHNNNIINIYRTDSSWAFENKVPKRTFLVLKFFQTELDLNFS